MGDKKRVKVASLAGAWIEIIIMYVSLTKAYVAPLMRVWIKIYQRYCYFRGG